MSEKRQSSMGNGNLFIRPNGTRIIRQYVELEWHDMSGWVRVVKRYHGRWGGQCVRARVRDGVCTEIGR